MVVSQSLIKFSNIVWFLVIDFNKCLDCLILELLSLLIVLLQGIDIGFFNEGKGTFLAVLAKVRDHDVDDLFDGGHGIGIILSFAVAVGD